MPLAKSAISRQTFQFLRELGRNNDKEWMDAHRERYQAELVRPLRLLFEQVAPAVWKLDDRFDTSGRTGPNFSRINRDIRFSKDKTLYKTQMYLKFSVPAPGNRESGQLYVGFSIDAVTVGFRIYSGAKRKESTLAVLAGPRVDSDPGWVGRQKKRLARRYESYWYTAEKGAWKRRAGWPADPADWKKMMAWIVRRKFSPGAGCRAGFPREIAKAFRELYPLLGFTSLADNRGAAR